MIRLVGKNAKINLTCNKLFSFDTGLEIEAEKYEILKAGAYLSVTNIDTKDNSFKVGLEEIIDPDTLEVTYGDPLCELYLGEKIYLKTDKFDFECDVIDKIDNNYQISLPFPRSSYDSEFKGSVKRIKDVITLIDIDEGVYYTDTGYIIVVNETFQELLRVSIDDIFTIDNIAANGMKRWQLHRLIQRAYYLVMDELQIWEDDFITQYKYLDIDKIMSLQAYKVLSLYETTTAEPSYKYTRIYDSMMKDFQPTFTRLKDATPEVSKQYNNHY